MNHPAPPPHDVWDDPRITAYATGQLSEQAGREFERRMAGNAELTAAVEAAGETLDTVAAQLRRTEPLELPPDVIDSILATQPASPATKPVDRRPGRLRRWMPGLSVAATLAIVAGLAVSAIRRPREIAMGRVDQVAEATLPEPAGGSVETEVPQNSPEVPVADATGEMSADGATAPAEPWPAAGPEAVAEFGTAPAFGGFDLPSSGGANSGGPPPASARGQERPRPAGGMGMMMGQEGRTRQGIGMESAMGMDGSMGMDGMGMDGMGMGGPDVATGGYGLPASLDEITLADVGTPHRGETASNLDRLRRVTEGRRGGDRFDLMDENPLRRVVEHPLSTFSIDVDTASYAKVREYLRRGQLPPPGAVRIEEMINYFEYDYGAPPADSDAPFQSNLAMTSCPWNPKHRLLRVGIQARQMAKKQRPPCNLVFLIDTSGSMAASNKLSLLTDGLLMLLDGLTAEDRVGIVTYAGSAELALDSTPADQTAKIRRAITRLVAGGGTNGGAGLRIAYDLVADHKIDGGVNRVVLCSDGDFNVGTTSTDQLVAMAESEAKNGIELTVLGFGMGNHNDAMMEQISNRGAGNYAFIDTPAEARKVLVDGLTGTLVTVASDVKLQIEFNPAVVAAYRLIGYENRMLAKEDFNDDTKDAGEIGAGHQVTALYELVPWGTAADAAAPPVDALKYQQPSAVSGSPSSTEALTLKIRFKRLGQTVSEKMESTVQDSGGTFERADAELRFAAAVAGYGMMLRRGGLAGRWSPAEILSTAAAAAGDNDRPRGEFLELLRRAAALIERGD